MSGLKLFLRHRINIKHEKMYKSINHGLSRRRRDSSWTVEHIYENTTGPRYKHCPDPRHWSGWQPCQGPWSPEPRQHWSKPVCHTNISYQSPGTGAEPDGRLLDWSWHFWTPSQQLPTPSMLIRNKDGLSRSLAPWQSQNYSHLAPDCPAWNNNGMFMAHKIPK